MIFLKIVERYLELWVRRKSLYYIFANFLQHQETFHFLEVHI